jgi:hypothetical protein
MNIPLQKKDDCFVVRSVPAYAVQYGTTKYAVTQYGEVYNLLTGKREEPKAFADKWPRVSMHYVAHMVASLFLAKPPAGGGRRLKHIDGDANNNYFRNLKWVETGRGGAGHEKA